MNFFRTLLSVFVLSTLIHFSAFSQSDTVSINTIVEKMQKLTDEHPLEKVYVHFDKPYYAVGDTMWFKAYLTSSLHMPSQLSKVVYLDVINSRDSLIQTIRLQVTNSVAPGHLILAQNQYTQGNYRFRAYTRWMLNLGDAYFFSKNISIGNTINKELITNINVSGENTDKASRVNARVQFKDEAGKPYVDKKVSWRVISGYETVAKGRSSTDANGYITVAAELKAPLKNGELEAIISITDGRSVTRNFPLRGVYGKPDIQFLAEGGRLISGVPSNIAFKAIRSDGLGIDVKGTVVDNTGAPVCEFSSRHLGMGVLSFVPEAEKTYKANVVFSDGSKSTVDLPKPRTSGIGLSVNNQSPDQLVIRIASTPAYLERHKDESFYIVARSAGVTCYAAQMKLQNLVYSANVPKAKFPSGIVQLTLFTSTGSPVSERIAFVMPHSGPELTLTSDKPAYTTRGKVRLNITAKYPAQPVTGSYSVAVVDETKVPYAEDAETTILSSLLLSTDLVGYVEKPNYYFNHTDAKKLADLDVLMLTQGYRSFLYRDILEDKYPPRNYLPEQGIELTGTLRMFSGLPVNRGTVQFIIPDKNFSVSTQTDADGKFRFTNLVFPDSVKAILSARGNANSKNMMLMVDGDILPGVTANVNAAEQVLNIDSTMHAYLQNSKKIYRTSVVLSEVVVKAKSTPKPSHADYPALSGLSMMPDHLIPGDSFKACPLLLDCLKGGAMGLTFYDENFYVSRDYNQGSRVPVQVFLNGMPVDATNLASVNSAEVESVEIFLRDDLGTVNRLYNTNGVLVVNTKKAPKGTPMKLSDLQSLLPQSNLLNFDPLGYLKVKQFYSPKYTVAKAPVSNDLRSTVYWNPAVETDEAGKAAVEFFNADGRGPYKAVIEGFDKDGNLSRYIYRYTVK